MNRTRLLVVGAGGFLARHFLAISRIADTAELVTVGRSPEGTSSSMRHHTIDCGDSEKLGRIVEEEAPTDIISFVGNFDGKLETQIKYNVGVASTLLSASSRVNSKTRVVLMGSVAEYGIPETCPLHENSELRPISLYGLTKMMQSQLANHFYRDAENKVLPVVARLANLLGPGLSEQLAFGSFVKQVSTLEEGGSLKVGNLDSLRDFVHVTDAVRALDAILAVKRPKPVYLVSSGRERRVGELLDYLVDQSGKRIRVVVDRNRVREGEVSNIYCSHALLTEDTSWIPACDAETALLDMLKDSGQHVSQSQ